MSFEIASRYTIMNTSHDVLFLVSGSFFCLHFPQTFPQGQHHHRDFRRPQHAVHAVQTRRPLCPQHIKAGKGRPASIDVFI